MKRSSSPENLETADKKSKKGDENEEEPGSTSQICSDLAENDGSRDEMDTQQFSTEKGDVSVETPSRSSDTPSSTAETVAPPITIDDKASPAPASSNDQKQDNGQEFTPFETKEEDRTEEKKWERWQLVPTTARQRMNYLLTTSKLSDCTVMVGKPEAQQEFKLHSVILGMSSPEFEDLLIESKDILIPDVEPDIFKQVLEYVYLDYVNLWSVEKTQALYRASVKFKLPHLCEKAVEYMMAKMSLDSIWPIFDAAIATQDQILTDECNKFFKKNINELLKHPNFPTVDYSVINNIVSDDSLGVSEVDLISGVLRWAHQKCVEIEVVPNLENKRNILLSDTIGKLRFLALTKEHFVSHVAYSKSKGDESILTMEESYAILMNMVQLNSYPMPEGFSTLVKPRTLVELARLTRRVFNPLGTYQPINPQGPRLDKLTVLPGPALTAPFGCKSFSLDLIVSKGINLLGIQVPTFFPGMIGSVQKLYEETYIVSIQNSSKPNKTMIGSINWSGKVAYNSSIDLFFKENVRLERSTTYTIMVYTHNPYYLNQKLCTSEDSNGVKFTFKDSVAVYGKTGTQDYGFISQLLFSV